MIEKIKKAAMEGVLLSKTLHFILKMIPRLPHIFLTNLDWICGCFVRTIYTLCTKIDSRQIMFICFQGDYTCNQKYIYEELKKRNASYNIVFSARKASKNRPGLFPPEVHLVEQYSAEYYQEIARSKIIIANSVEFLKKPVPKRRQQIVIETWHGSLGIKRFDADSNKGRSWVLAAKRCGRYADYIISNSAFENEVYRGTFWQNTPILEFGHPRNDILFAYNYEHVQLIKREIIKNEENLDHHLVLYAPTFRDDHKLSYYNIDFDSLVQALSDRFGGSWSVLVRLHPTIRKAAKKYLRNHENIIDVTAYPDIQELMMISDVAITDYSSWIYDYILTRRPGFIFATDIYSYETERGFYYPLSSTPFPVSTNNETLIENILLFDEKQYEKNVDVFLEEKGCIDDGHASQRVVDKIIELVGGSS